MPNSLAEKVNKILNVVHKKKPSIGYSEAAYNHYLVFPLLDVLMDEFDDHEASPFFLPGEERLAAMKTQLGTLKKVADHRKIYKADEIIRE